MSLATGRLLTLDEFLRLPGIDERPYKEYIDGRVETKMSPRKKHSLVTLRLLNHISVTRNRVAWGCRSRSCAARSPAVRSFPTSSSC